MAPKNIKLFQPAHSYLDYLFLLLDRCFSFYFSSGILSCSAVLVCNSEFYGLSFLTNFSLHLSPFPVFKTLAFHSLILIKTETSSTNEISPYNTINFFLSICFWCISKSFSDIRIIRSNTSACIYFNICFHFKKLACNEIQQS